MFFFVCVEQKTIIQIEMDTTKFVLSEEFADALVDDVDVDAPDRLAIVTIEMKFVIVSEFWTNKKH